jgi:hypothetical protein
LPQFVLLTDLTFLWLHIVYAGQQADERGDKNFYIYNNPYQMRHHGVFQITFKKMKWKTMVQSEFVKEIG